MISFYVSPLIMNRYKKRAKICAIIGVIAITIISSLLHFGFEFFGKIKWTAIVFAVNESVWEHLKIGFFAALIYYILEYFIYGNKFTNFFPAKVIDLLLIPFLTALFFYGYTYFLDDNLILDIMTLVLSIIIAQIVGYKITLSKKKLPNRIFLITLIILLIIFPLFTFYPPKINLFYDFAHKRYGI